MTHDVQGNNNKNNRLGKSNLRPENSQWDDVIRSGEKKKIATKSSIVIKTNLQKWKERHPYLYSHGLREFITKSTCLTRNTKESISGRKEVT